MERILGLFTFLPLFLAGSCGTMLPSTSQPKMNLTVMTYNLRHAAAPDGVNSWEFRRSLVMDRIRKHSPDVLGVQEALDVQIRELDKEFPDYIRVGVGRDDGITKGEYSAIYFKRERLGLREGGTRWISSEPEKPGTKGPGANIPRIFSWAELFTQDGRRILVLNAHWDHQSEPARLLAAQQMRAFVDSRKGIPTLVMGDFNCDPQSKPVQALVAGGRLELATLQSGPYGTFNGFDPAKVDGEMIDHIAITGEWRFERVEIDRTIVNGRTPSDHWPVIASVNLR